MTRGWDFYITDILAALKAAQRTNVDATQLSKLKGFSFSYVMFKEISLLCDISTGVPRPVIPAEFRRRVFLSIHNLSHSGTRAQETTHPAMGVEGDAGGHLQVQGVRSLPGVQGHQAHRPWAPRDPGALQPVHRG